MVRPDLVTSKRGHDHRRSTVVGPSLRASPPLEHPEGRLIGPLAVVEEDQSRTLVVAERVEKGDESEDDACGSVLLWS
jgi:hypothetical protein